MKFSLPLLVVAATQLIGCSDGAAQALCKTSATVTNYNAITPDTITNYNWAFASCTLKHYRSSCLNDEFHQRVSEDDFVSQSFLGNPVYTTDDLRLDNGQPPAHCVSPINLVGLWPYDEPTKVIIELVESSTVNPDGELLSFQRPQWVGCCERTSSNLQGETVTSCSPDFCGQGRNRHNRLLKQIEEFGITKFNNEALQDFDDKCGDYEYELKMHVDEHLYLILDPSKEALANGCETILLHATDTNFEL